jgi:hypothetical protein
LSAKVAAPFVIQITLAARSIWVSWRRMNGAAAAFKSWASANFSWHKASAFRVSCTARVAASFY